MKKKTMLLPPAAVAATLMITACGQEAASSEASATNASETATTAGSKTEEVVESGAAAKNSAAAKTTYPLTFKIYDAGGKEVEMDYVHASERVLSTQLSMTELLIELGLKDKIVAVFDNDNALKGDVAIEIASLKNLGDKKSVSKESVLALESDLILDEGPLMLTDMAIGTVQSYQELGIPVHTEFTSASADQSLKSIPEDVHNIGKIFDMQKKADAYVAELGKRIDALLTKVSNQTGEPKKILFVAGYTGGTFTGFNLRMSGCMLKALNTENVLERNGNGLTLENLISMNPDVIAYVHSDHFAAADVSTATSLSENQVVRDVPAIKSRKIIEIDYDDVMDYGAHVIDSTEKLYGFMYEEWVIYLREGGWAEGSSAFFRKHTKITWNEERQA